jgi:4'-phosphopantetheinyl transferase EntD
MSFSSTPFTALRAQDTPAHAHHDGVRLVPVPCPIFDNDADWRAQRVELVGSGQLHPREATMADLLPLARRGTFVAGRVALRAALRDTTSLADDGGVIPPVLRNSRGAPVLPPGVAGSISHKETLALAAVAPLRGDLRHLGVDLERRPLEEDLARPSIAPRVLTAHERTLLAESGLDALAQRERVLIHFEVKEAVYKAIDPFVGRYVGFAEVELRLEDDRAHVSLLLPELSEDDVRVAAQWYVDGPWIVATAFSHR